MTRHGFTSHEPSMLAETMLRIVASRRPPGFSMSDATGRTTERPPCWRARETMLRESRREQSSLFSAFELLQVVLTSSTRRRLLENGVHEDVAIFLRFREVGPVSGVFEPDKLLARRRLQHVEVPLCHISTDNQVVPTD